MTRGRWASEWLANLAADMETLKLLKSIPAQERERLWRDMGLTDDKIAELQAAFAKN